MTVYELLSLVIQALTGAAIVASFWVYYSQLNALRDGSRAQNMLAVANYLQREDVRTARAFVIRALAAKEYDDWDHADKQQASLVCSSFDTACIFVKNGLYPMDLFLDTYGPSLTKCYSVLRAFIEDLQQPHNAGPSYWDDFVHLAKRAQTFIRPAKHVDA